MGKVPDPVRPAELPTAGRVVMMNCQRCNGLLLPDHSRDSVGPVCVNCGRSAYLVPPEVLVSLAAERRPNRKVGPSPSQPK